MVVRGVHLVVLLVFDQIPVHDLHFLDLEIGDEVVDALLVVVHDRLFGLLDLGRDELACLRVVQDVAGECRGVRFDM